MIVVLDCNIWITLTINGQLDFLTSLDERGIIIASCNRLKTEISGVLNRQKIKKFTNEADIAKVVEMHDLITMHFNPSEIDMVTDDPKDDYLFALALESEADYLVTGDKLLLKVSDYKTTKLITLRHFRDILDL